MFRMCVFEFFLFLMLHCQINRVVALIQRIWLWRWLFAQKFFALYCFAFTWAYFTDKNLIFQIFYLLHHHNFSVFQILHHFILFLSLMNFVEISSFKLGSHLFIFLKLLLASFFYCYKFLLKTINYYLTLLNLLVFCLQKQFIWTLKLINPVWIKTALLTS